MQGALRRTLAESHIAAMTVAALFLVFLELVYWAIWNLTPAVVNSWQVVRVRGRFDFSAFALHSLFRHNAWVLSSIVSLVIDAGVAVASAWILSYWVYGTDPVHCLAAYSGKLSRRSKCLSD